MGSFLSIDETALSNGELYTILTNKQKKGKKGSLVAIIKGTKAEFIIDKLRLIPLEKRIAVLEVTLDMANSMNLIVQKSFPKAKRVTDRFHVQKLAFEAVQDVRIKYRWIVLNEENKADNTFQYENGDSKRQLLAISRYLLFKISSKWTISQRIRANLLFKEYPKIEKAYKIAMELMSIYENTTLKGVAYTKMAQWFNKIELSNLPAFKTIKKTFHKHYEPILNYFEKRSTNASAESFNAKIKDFRRAFRGVRDIEFFLFRVAKIFA